MEAEAALQLNIGQFESSSEHIGQSFLEPSNPEWAARNLFRVGHLWKVIIASAVLLFVIFAGIAMLVHIVHSQQNTSPSLVSNNHHVHPLTPLSWKDRGKYAKQMLLYACLIYLKLECSFH